LFEGVQQIRRARGVEVSKELLNVPQLRASV
jgi:hypothetical protein